jgi:hypothetical protein
MALVLTGLYLTANPPKGRTGLGIKIGVEHLQLLNALSLFKIQFSPCLDSLFSLSSVSTLGVSALDNLCLLQAWSDFDKLWLVSSLPLVMMVLLMPCVLVIRLATGRKEHLIHDTIRAAAQIMFLIHPTITKSCFTFWRSEEIEGELRLAADYRVLINSSEHREHEPLTICTLVVFVVGSPLAYFVVMKYARLQEKPSDDKPSGHLALSGGWIYESLGFSYAHFSVRKKLSVYWELVRTIRKAALIAISVFVVNSDVQGYCGLMLCMNAALLVGWVKPFRHQVKQYNSLELVSMITVALTEILARLDLKLAEHASFECSSAADLTLPTVLILTFNFGLLAVLIILVLLEVIRQHLYGTSVEEQLACDRWLRLTKRYSSYMNMLKTTPGYGALRSRKIPSVMLQNSALRQNSSALLDVESDDEPTTESDENGEEPTPTARSSAADPHALVDAPPAPTRVQNHGEEEGLEMSTITDMPSVPALPPAAHPSFRPVQRAVQATVRMQRASVGRSRWNHESLTETKSLIADLDMLLANDGDLPDAPNQPKE